MAGVTALTILLQVAAVYVPFLERFFQVVPHHRLADACTGG
jgi:hypothetical protein